MVSTNEMKGCKTKYINLYFVDGEVWNNVYVDWYIQAEDEGEEPMLEIGSYLINQSEIKKIELIK